jgi:hypothetical protein
MSREAHVRFREGWRGRFPPSTRLIITGDTKGLLENEVRPLVEQFLKERGLTLSADKTRLTHSLPSINCHNFPETHSVGWRNMPDFRLPNCNAQITWTRDFTLILQIFENKYARPITATTY